MSDGITVYTTAFDTAFAGIAATSKRDLLIVAEEQFRGVIRHVIGVTPPAYRFQTEGGAWNSAHGGEAKRHGEALVKSDIRSVYGTPSEAFREIRAKDAKRARAFWRHVQQGDDEIASNIARKHGVAGMYVFDGGTAHKRLKGGHARGHSRRPIFYVTPESEPFLKAYIMIIQERVGWLAAGWREAAQQLGVALPQWIGRHPAPSAARIETSDHNIKIVATNAVRFASQTGDLTRRVQYALDQQAAAMNRRLDDYMKRKFRIPGVILTR